MSNRITVVTTLVTAIEALRSGAFLIATHGGPAIHADEAAAVALAATTHPNRVVVVFRVERDDKEGLAWAKQSCAYVLDVGGKAGDEPAVVLDHHFLGLDAPEAAKAKAIELGLDPDKMSGKDYQQVVDLLGHSGVPYSSAGLLLRHLVSRGHDVLDRPSIKAIVASIDASDNGIKGVWHNVAGVPEGIAMLIHKAAIVPLRGGEVTVEETALHFKKIATAFVALFEGVGRDGGAQFAKVMEDLAAEADAGRQASAERVKSLLDTAGQVLVLGQYEAAALDVLGANAESSPVLYLVFPSGGQWMCQQAPLRPMPCFDGKKPLPGSWAGLRDEAFQKETGVEDGVFCHPGRFICGAKSREGAVRLAHLAAEA